MLSSYQFSERFTAQSILFDSCRLTVAGIRKTSAIVGRTSAIVSHFGPYALGGAVGVVLGLALFAAVSAIPVTFWLGLAITGAFAYATFPRHKSRPSKCPYCGSRHISGGLGHWDCDDCGRGGSY